jgi:glycosyltransferase involved in cell wall biosynthesis
MQDGVEITLLSCDDSLKSRQAKIDFFERLDIKKTFEIVSLESYANLLKKSKWRILNWAETILANISITNYIMRHSNDYDTLYYRDCSLFLPILVSKYLYGKPIFIEIHAILHKKFGQLLNDFFARISDGLIAITHGLKTYYEKINPMIIVSFCAAAEPEKFEKIIESKEQLRQELNLPLNKIILMYSGNLSKTGNFDSYGIEDIINAVALMDKRIIFVCIGKKGNETDVHESLSSQLKIKDRVVFLPWVNRDILYRYWKASDILIHPAAGAQVGNSPTKIFEYLASGRPIISAGTEPIKEVLTDRYNSLLVMNYKDPKEWVKAVKTILIDDEIVNRIVNNANDNCRKYTWKGRGREIINFINKYN